MYVWCDAYVGVKYPGLNKKALLKTETLPNRKHAQWNHEFEIPVPLPVLYEHLTLLVYDANRFSADELVGKCTLNIKDIVKAGHMAPAPVWVNLYIDADGKPPKYRGRLLLEVKTSAYESKDMKSSPALSSASIPRARMGRAPSSSACKLEIEVYEGIHLENNYNTYQVDVTLGYSTGIGMSTTTFPSKKQQLRDVVPFMCKTTVIVEDIPMKLDAKTNEVVPASLAMVPDIIIYVSKYGDPSKCVGYLRIPVCGKKRPTEQWEYGEDLTIIPDLWATDTDTHTHTQREKKHRSPRNKVRCLPLKPLYELYSSLSSFLLFRYYYY